jgi:5-methylcytosine-specific restriction endonuclease McrA
MPGKRCTRCLEWKPESEFYRDRTKLDGLKSQCKDCRRDYKREYRRRMRALAQVRLKRVMRRVWQPQVRLEDRIRDSAGFRRWRDGNRARRKAYVTNYLREWHRAHPNARLPWHVAHPELLTAQRQVRRADAAGASVNDLSAAEWRWLCEVYDHRCAYCGAPTDDLTLDHVMPLAQGGSNTLSNVVPACRACNTDKGARTPEQADMAFAVRVDVATELEQIALI